MTRWLTSDCFYLQNREAYITLNWEFISWCIQFNIYLHGRICVSTDYKIRTQQDIDMVWTGLTISPVREEAVDFSYPFWEESIGLLTATQPVDQFFVFRPLHVYVWICFIGMPLVTAVVIRHLESLYPYSEDSHALPFTRLGTCMVYTFGAVLYQGKLYE